jgi:quinol monooxygenase YgiN
MIAAFFKVSIKPGKKEELLEFLKWDCQVSRDEEPGTLRFDTFEDPNNENVVYFYEAYVDVDGFEAHKEVEPFKKFIGGLKNECIESSESTFPNWTEAYCTTAE